MTTIGPALPPQGTQGLSAGNARPMTREEFFASQAELDQMYDQHLASTKQYQTLSKAEVKASPDPWSAMGRMKLSDRERGILAEVAKLNGWSRQATEATYQMYFAGPSENNSIGDFLKDLTAHEPGSFFEGGGVILGLHEADRRRLLGLPPVDETTVQQGIAEDEIAAPPAKKDEAAPAWVGSSLARPLSEEEKLAVAQAAKLNGWDAQSAAAAFRMYIAENSEGSRESFLQLLVQRESDAYDRKGELGARDDDPRNWLLDIRA